MLSMAKHHTPYGFIEIVRLLHTPLYTSDVKVYYYSPLGMEVPVRDGTYDQRENQASEQSATCSRPGASARARGRGRKGLRRRPSPRRHCARCDEQPHG